METWYYEVVSIDGDYANLRYRIKQKTSVFSTLVLLVGAGGFEQA